MIGELTNHLWQSTLFALVAGLLTIALRRNRAHVRYWLWFSASLKFFVPFALLMSLGSQLDWAPAAKTITTPAVTFAMEQITQPFPEAIVFGPSTPDATDWTSVAIVGVWVCGFAAILLIRVRGWMRIRAALRASSLVESPVPVEVRSAPGLLEPGVVGLWRPMLLLPADIEQHLTAPQLEAVLAHELCHVRRRDNLTSAIHMVVEAVFWFHPLVWWISARLVEERERACDEEVLRLGGDPQVYAEGIVNVCKMYVESPLACVSGVTGSDLKKRIEAIMINRSVLRLNFAKKAALAAAGIVALTVPLVVGMMRAQAPAAKPKFDVASIRPCGGRGGKSKDGTQGSGGVSSPGTLSIRCESLLDSDGILGIIHRAYDRYADGRINPWALTRISGGPAWIKSEFYDINAKAEGNPSEGMMNGPMLQALLEDRFKLRVHRESIQVPVYELTVAKGGPKLAPFKEGSCAFVDFTKSPLPALEPGEKPCRGGIGMRRGPNIALETQRTSMEEFCNLLGLVLDRPVNDKTGIRGFFDFNLAFGVDQSTPRYLPGGDMANFPGIASDDLPAPTIFTVVQELGLKLEATRGPREFIVIDSVERPSEN